MDRYLYESKHATAYMDDNAMMFGNPCKPKYIDIHVKYLSAKISANENNKSIGTVQVSRNTASTSAQVSWSLIAAHSEY